MSGLGYDTLGRPLITPDRKPKGEVTVHKGGYRSVLILRCQNHDVRVHDHNEHWFRTGKDERDVSVGTWL